tara:strand:- start:48 stop:545 length:498 start_codon:yes stop_codon:yes gene_type:complete
VAKCKESRRELLEEFCGPLPFPVFGLLSLITAGVSLFRLVSPGVAGKCIARVTEDHVATLVEEVKAHEITRGKAEAAACLWGIAVAPSEEVREWLDSLLWRFDLRFGDSGLPPAKESKALNLLSVLSDLREREGRAVGDLEKARIHKLRQAGWKELASLLPQHPE